MPADGDVKAWIASRHVPTRLELDALVAKFFVAVDADAIARLEAAWRGVLADKASLAQHQQLYRANLRDCHGLLWYEQEGRHAALPSPVELALWLGSMTPGFPQARGFCPPQLVGHWSDRDTRWRLGDDGSFECSEPALAKQRTWCVHLVEGNRDLRREGLWLYAGPPRTSSPMKLVIGSASEATLHLIRTGGSFADVEYHLTRNP
jgi:hypothetical protein